MRPKPLYEALAGLLIACDNCRKDANTEWLDKHTETIERLVREHMPSGSGFDSGTSLDLDESRRDKLVFSTSYHHMNENGFYDGWTEHQVIVRPSLFCQFELRITGRDRNEIKDYIYECFDIALRAEVTE